MDPQHRTAARTIRSPAEPLDQQALAPLWGTPFPCFSTGACVSMGYTPYWFPSRNALIRGLGNGWGTNFLLPLDGIREQRFPQRHSIRSRERV